MAFFMFKMNETQKVRCQKYSTIIGCILLLLPNGIFWYWGNMSVYCMSYILFVHDSSANVDTPWILSLYFVFWSLGVLSTEFVARRIGRKKTMLVGVIAFNTGILCSFFTVQNSLIAVTCTMGATTGIGTGLMDGSALQLGIDWSEGSVGFITAVLQGSIPLGAPIVNQMVTLFTNPNNLYPNFYQSPTMYFTQKEVLDRVPYMFLIIGCFSSCLHLIALTMVRQKPTSLKVNSTNDNIDSSSASQPIHSLQKHASDDKERTMPSENTKITNSLHEPTSNNQERMPSSENTKSTYSLHESASNNQERTPSSENTKSTYSLHAHTSNDQVRTPSSENTKITNNLHTHTSTDQETTLPTENIQITDSPHAHNSNNQGRPPSSGNNIMVTSDNESADYTVKEMLETKSFYTMWITFFISGLPLVLAGNYYKTFGQIWIKDDYFITNIATIMPLLYAALSAFWGLALDMFGVKTCHIAFSSLAALMLFWFYFSAMFSRWVYFVMTLVFGCLTGPLFSCYTVSVILLYGKTHFTTNFGILMVAQLCFNLVSPEMVGYSLTHFGWFTTFAASGALVALGLIPTMIFIPNTKGSYRLKVV